MFIVRGNIWKFCHGIDTDVIIPARYLNTIDPAELAKHCMEDADKDFMKKVKPGDIIVAGKNFGCGSSREHAPLSIKGAKISLVIAESFARIFYRNAINIGLPILELKESDRLINEGDELVVDLDKGTVKNLNKNEEYQAQAYPKFMKELIAAGGLINWVKSEKKGD